MLFEELGFDYVGPIDGHNVDLLIETLKRIKTASSPTLVHVITKKGKGYEFSEKDPAFSTASALLRWKPVPRSLQEASATALPSARA